ncbi:MAG: hypothetical protein QG652_750 [Pseudomonadota bacterium]|nr:hypothetical protein [Pseudomonadota bacterium]
MLSLKQICSVSEDHQVTIRLPDSIVPGEHEIIIVLDQKESKNFDPMTYSGVVDWPIDGLVFQKQSRNEWK